MFDVSVTMVDCRGMCGRSESFGHGNHPHKPAVVSMFSLQADLCIVSRGQLKIN